MDQLFSPWRSQYIQSFKSEDAEKRCVFCDALASEDDERTLIVHRGALAFIVMNLYPYNSGHLMVIPNRHTADFQSLSSEELIECQKLLQAGQRALDATIKPHAYNLGMNLGRIAGAGIDDHLHWHIVPRWNGDTNFMPVLADVKLVSEDMRKLWAKLHNAMPSILSENR
jgi:ATP adenylyltransferase